MIMTENKSQKKHHASRNACKLCTPFGACLAFKGVENSMTLLHGSQGCATYIRRYMISHYREPIDIASSNFTEDTAIFGGQKNFSTALINIIKQYSPKFIGIATTCLSETIGDDPNMLLHQFKKENKLEDLPDIGFVSTPSYTGTHADGFYSATRSIAVALAEKTGFQSGNINVIPSMVSPADLRYLREIVSSFTDMYSLFPDYSDTLDGGSWEEYQAIPTGGTAIDEIKRAGDSAATIELFNCCNDDSSAGVYLEAEFSVPNSRIGIPIGIRQTDKFINMLAKITGSSIPVWLRKERSILVDSYVDAHKYIFGKKAVVFGDEDTVSGIISLLLEIGVVPVVALSGGKSGKLETTLRDVNPELGNEIMIFDGADFETMGETIRVLKPDMLIGNSKGYMLSRELNIPLIRTGFPIHDRFGGARTKHIGYRGAQELFDRIVNAVIESRQDTSDWGYTYM